MTPRRGAGLAAALATVALALPGSALAHAYPITSYPLGNKILSSPPSHVSVTYDEAVEPRFAIMSVTNLHGQQEAVGAPAREPGDPDTLYVDLRAHLARGWYLVYWRVISIDGHPVQNAFVFAVGPNPGLEPAFHPPNIAQSATTTPLLLARWAMFLTVMAAIGLFVLRAVIARPLAQRVAGASLRPLTLAFGLAALAGLVAVPVYLEEATAIDSLKSFLAVGTLVPLFRVTSSGRGYVDLELCFALFCAAAGVALWVDRPERGARPVAALIATLGAAVAAAATLAIPGAAGHAAQTAPRPLALLLDWVHLVSGSLWIGGLIGLLVLWWGLPAARRLPALALCVPRFSRMALVAVALLLGSGVGAAVLHLPILAALWTTGYGETILAKAALLALAMLLGALNLLRTRPRLVAAGTLPELGRPALRLLRRAVSGELALLVVAVGAAALLSSLAPPSPALAEEGKALAQVGPGRVDSALSHGGYFLQVLISPNKTVGANRFGLRITHDGAPVDGATVTLTFTMLDMQMGSQEYVLAQSAPGTYTRSAPSLIMVGHWGLSFAVTPPGGSAFSAFIVDDAGA